MVLTWEGSQITIDELKDPRFRVWELNDEDFVIYEVAVEALESGDAEFARQIIERKADRVAKVHFRLFFSNAWPQPVPSSELWDEVISRTKLRKKLNTPEPSA